jgi:hypothetical protein
MESNVYLSTDLINNHQNVLLIADDDGEQSGDELLIELDLEVKNGEYLTTAEFGVVFTAKKCSIFLLSTHSSVSQDHWFVRLYNEEKKTPFFVHMVARFRYVAN